MFRAGRVEEKREKGEKGFFYLFCDRHFFVVVRRCYVLTLTPSVYFYDFNNVLMVYIFISCNAFVETLTCVI